MSKKFKIDIKLLGVRTAVIIMAITFTVSAGIIAPISVSAASFTPVYRYTKIPDVQASSSTVVGGVATDASGNSFVAGEFSGTVNFAGTGGNDTITSTYGTAYITKHASNGSYGWTHTLDSSNNGYAQAMGVATDTAGNSYVVGNFSGGVTFDGPGGANSQSINGSGAFVNKYSPSGVYQWTKTITPPANGNAGPQSIATDANGNIYITGNFNGTVNFAGGSGGTDNHTDAGGNGDNYLTRFNADGSYAWTQTLDTTSGGSQNNGIAIDANGAIYLTGYFSGSVNFNSAGSDVQTDSSGNGGTYITKLSTAGTYAWTRTFSGDSSSYVGPLGIAADPSGDVYVTGYLDGTANFAGSGGSDIHTDAGGSGDTFVTKYTASGSYGWTKIFDTSTQGSSAFGQAITTDMLGDIYVVSAFSGAVNFAGSAGADVQSQNQSGALTMYAPDGSYRWTKVLDTSNGTAVTTQGVNIGVAADRLGNIYLGSVFTGTVGFDGPAGIDQQTAGGYGASFLTSYKTFDPASLATGVSSASSPVSSVTPAAAIKAPDTGFGTVSGSNYASYSLVAAGAIITAAGFSMRRLVVLRHSRLGE